MNGKSLKQIEETILFKQMKYSQNIRRYQVSKNRVKLCCLTLTLRSVGAVLEGKPKYMFENKYKWLNSPWIDKDTFTGVKSPWTRTTINTIHVQCGGDTESSGRSWSHGFKHIY